MMKKYLASIFTITGLIMIAFPLSGQNWQPLADTSYIYNYQLDGKTDIFPLFADSLQGDTLFANQMIVECDTCSLNQDDYCRFISNPATIHWLKYPHFLQHKIIPHGQGKVQFLGPGNKVVFAQSPEGFSWLFDSVQNVLATTISVTSQEIFGNSDSLRVMILSTGDSIVISKNHGFIQFPFKYGKGMYFRLLGIEGKGSGRLMPGMMQFYDFQIGDKFEWHEQNRVTDAITITTVRQIEILNRKDLSNSIIYGVNGIKLIKYPDREDQAVFVKKFIVSDSSFSAFTRNEISKAKAIPDCFYTINGFETDDEGMITLRTGYYRNYYVSDAVAEKGILFKQNIRDLPDPTWYSLDGEVYQEGFGRVQMHRGGDRYYTNERLVAYRKNGIESGDFTRFDFSYISSDSLATANSIFIHPNPVAQILKIEFEINPGLVSYQIISSKGDVLQEGEFTTTKSDFGILDLHNHSFTGEVNISNRISNGLYFLTVKSSLGKAVEKFIIMR